MSLFKNVDTKYIHVKMSDMFNSFFSEGGETLTINVSH